MWWGGLIKEGNQMLHIDLGIDEVHNLFLHILGIVNPKIKVSALGQQTIRAICV